MSLATNNDREEPIDRNRLIALVRAKAEIPLEDPKITPLQFEILLALILRGKMYGRELRGELTRQGQPLSHSAFSHLMGRLTKASYVTKEIDEREKGDFAERIYSVTENGLDVWAEMVAYFRQNIADLLARNKDLSFLEQN